MIKLQRGIIYLLVIWIAINQAFIPSSRSYFQTVKRQLTCSSTKDFYDYEQRLVAFSKKAVTIKCPFFRRRAIDFIESTMKVMNFLIARHKSTPLSMLAFNIVRGEISKVRNATIDEIAMIIRNDWNIRDEGHGDGKGYYITGKLTHKIYHDECFFDGPDPDMPVKGLQKYLLSASTLFDKKSSRADLIKPIAIDRNSKTVKVYWRLEGILNLPWHPPVKPWTGSTTYHIGKSGLIERHVEVWDISVIDAFVSIVFPNWSFGAPPAAPIDTNIKL